MPRRRDAPRPGALTPPPQWMLDVEAGRVAMLDGEHGVFWPPFVEPVVHDAAVAAWQRDRRRDHCAEHGCYGPECAVPLVAGDWQGACSHPDNQHPVGVRQYDRDDPAWPVHIGG